MNQIQNYINTIQSNLELYNTVISPNNKKVISEYIQRLHRIDELLDVDKYKLVFIGAPGVGKTSLICNYLNLLTDKFVGKKKDDVPLLNTASGRTTAAEIHILTGKKSLIRIEPCSQKEQTSCIKSYCRSVWDKTFDKEIGSDEDNKSEDKTESAELYRMIKNMAGFTKENGYSKDEDIINEISQKYRAADYAVFCNEILNRTGITTRNTFSIPYDSKFNFKIWLKKTFSDINLGKCAGVSIPKRIYIQICQNDFELPLPEWTDEIIDTRGFDGEGRTDIKNLIQQDNTINIILDKITSPINKELYPIFNSWVIKENTDIIPRLSLVIACRDSELDSVCEAEDEKDGERIKISEIDTCIRSNRLNYYNKNTIFFNALEAYSMMKTPRKKDDPSSKQHYVIADIDSEIANDCREDFSKSITKVKDDFRNSLISEADDISQRAQNIFNSLKKQPTALDRERNRVASKLEEFKSQVMPTLTTNKRILNSFDSMFDTIKNTIHWASVRKTTEMYGEWEKCDIYAKIQVYLWNIVSQEISCYKNQIDDLLSSIDPQLSDYAKSYVFAEKNAFVKLKTQVENLGYNKMFLAFNLSEENPIDEFWNKAQSIYGKGYLGNVIACYKQWIDNNHCDKNLCSDVRQFVLLYFDTIIDIVS